ncbi:Uncharacterized protein OS=Singulisphaera acidiphila (strain ATCC BAA-1392 / DSM 18658 / VKM B-2454 / MOB10) GN=Sinac_4843 PE=4 SV=1 [Gemmata massiliana]|uniref:Carboxypeptidase regulatory-like domain-containing protein n=1 Tax=Gemmata massiliana TaxID=1210884 RepID=A0A6P2D3F5_9BACT|nr:hypothetical protein [Gemmata massiliana]VTR95623.1 Uncharacterized protein OS=Singulisphaera acidiphila (strain ATCC BAA-1392 / DSM 18658 / VKM B-2454 / MOB10) GN=Sinac_4843 PE=4 SV=1 [Gemmata massiliana]
MFRSSIRTPALALCVCLFLAGCGNSGIVSVSGTLTYKGQPVTNAIVHFVPEKGRPSMGETDQNGNFTLLYDPQTKGAQIGKHKVFIMHNAAADAGKPGTVPGAAPKMSADQRELFSKYSGDRSKVEVTIEKSMSDLKLTWD